MKNCGEKYWINNFNKPTNVGFFNQKNIMYKNIYCFTDFETDGVAPYDYSPIEIGCIFTDYKFNIIATYENLINPYPANRKAKHWSNDSELAAFNVHKISFQHLEDLGEVPLNISKDINYKLNHIKSIRPDLEKSRVVIVSDNAQFEYNCMRKLYKMAKQEDIFPFHYTAWDTNMLLNIEQPEIGDPKPVHRALADAGLLYVSVVRALEKNGTMNKIINYFEKSNDGGS